jgi:hypothetical protein
MTVQTRPGAAARGRPGHAALVQEQADRAARMYLAGRDNGQPDSLEAKRIIESVLSPSYDGRTLIELLQNGHDAHPRGTGNGRLAFRLDMTEGPHGVLYAANGGTPLTDETFGSLCRVAMSSKRPDESIGNKGVGFKSVLNLSDGPELYSKATEESAHFDGYCFRFARPEDFDAIARRVAPDEPGLADELRENVSSLKTPVPLDRVPEEVAAFGGWAATVVRLPLRDQSALERAREQLHELSAGDVPLHLFLPRLARIAIAVQDGGGEAPAELRRDVAPLAHSGDLRAETAVLQDGTQYALLRRRVPARTVLAAIGRSVDEGRLPESWLEWQGDGEVAIALPLTGELPHGRLYTYLPMGASAAAPVPALVNAPFFPDVDRRDLQREIPLNDMWFRELAELCADALVLSENDGLALPLEGRLDLACWSGPGLDRLRDAVRRRDSELHALRFVPALTVGATSVDTGWAWSGPDGEAFGPAAAARHGAAEFVDPALSPARRARLEELAGGCGYEVVADTSNLADFAVAIAASMAQQARPADEWAQFYDDLSQHRGLERHLPGRLIVAADDDGVVGANAPDTAVTVYFPPGTDDERVDGGDVPGLVRDRLAFMRADVPFVDRTAGRRRRPGRVWLEEHGLVREYRTDALLDLLGQVMRGTDAAVSSDGLTEVLTFAFRIWDGATKDVGADTTRRARLLVPARGGWTTAADAVFGRGWDGPDQDTDALLARLVNDSHEASPALAGLRDRTVPAPASVSPSAADRPVRWRVFLEALGVAHGLVPHVTPGGRLSGRGVNAPQTAHDYGPGVPAGQARPWREHARFRVRGRVQFETTDYSPSGVSALPGQWDWDDLGHRSRVDYAHLIVAGLASWPDTAFQVEFSRYSDDRRATWPSPLSYFLATRAWVPQTTPGNRSEISLAEPAAAWWVKDVETPDFLPAQPPVLRGTAGRLAVDRLRRCGVRVWDDSASAPDRLEELARHVDANALESRTVAALAIRKANEAAWRDLEQEQAAPPERVVASRRGELRAVRLGEETVYVPDQAGLAKEVLLAQTGQPILPVKDLALGERILAGYAPGRRLLPASAADVRVRLDGDWAETARAVPLPQAAPPWLALLVLAVMEFKHRGVPPVTPNVLRQAARALVGAVVAEGTAVTTFVDGHPVETVAGAGSFLVRNGDEQRLVVARGRTGTPLPEAAVPALAELVGLPQLADQLRLALFEIRGRCGTADPTPDDVAHVVGATPAELSELERFADGDSSDWSAVVAAAALVDPDAALDLREAARELATLDDVRKWLADRIAETRWTADQIVEASALRDVRDAIDALGVSLAHANAGLTAVGLAPVRNADGHRTQMRAHAAAGRGSIQNRLRNAYADAVTDPDGSAAAMREYLRLLDLPGLDADPAWLDEHWDVPASALEERVDRWLAAAAPPGPAPAAAGLPGIDDLRDTGRRGVAGVVRNAQVLVEAWLHRNSAGQGNRPPPAADAIEQITAAGLMDFGRLTPDQVLLWLTENGHWPETMAATTVRSEHSISEADMAAARDRLARARDDARRRTTYVDFGGRTFSEDPDDLRALALAVQEQATGEHLDLPIDPIALTPLAVAEPAPDKTRGRGKGFRAGGPPPEKAKAIGLAGEIYVGERLRQTFGLPPEDTWVSGYRNDILGDGKGSDSLGYDFEAVTPAGTLLIEVKATTGPDTQFSLKESEVRRAQALEPDETYIVVMVNYALDPARRTATPLPNPLGRAGLAHFRVLGSALRLQFQRAEQPVAPDEGDAG